MSINYVDLTVKEKITYWDLVSARAKRMKRRLILMAKARTNEEKAAINAEFASLTTSVTAVEAREKTSKEITPRS